MNRNGFTFLMAVYMVVILGILSAFTGKSWSVVMKREREKELIYRGSQIKEAIENWNNPRYTVPGVRPRIRAPLMDLKDLLQDPNTLTAMHFLPPHYAAELDDKNPKCAPDCAKVKIYQDPMTGKEWTIIRGIMGADGTFTPITGTQGGIIGVASKSDDAPLKSDFTGTALENMASVVVPTPQPGTGIVPPAGISPQGSTDATSLNGTTKQFPDLGGKMTKYSQWQFVAESPVKNDHTKIYRAYHEGW